MKINSIQRDISLKQGSSGFRSETAGFKEKCGTDICNTGYNTAYCGSFTGKSKPAANFLDKMLKSEWLKKFVAYSQQHNISTSALIALVLAGILRPATIMALPGDKDKDDKVYASGHAIASGIIGFVVSTIITSPFDESIVKIFEQGKFQREKLKKMTSRISELQKLADSDTITKELKAELKTLTKRKEALNTLLKNIPDWIIAIPRSILTIALIPPILKYVFGMEKKKKDKPVEQPKNNDNVKDIIEKSAFKNIMLKGGTEEC